jgi:hypothetical protein
LKSLTLSNYFSRNISVGSFRELWFIVHVEIAFFPALAGYELATTGRAELQTAAEMMNRARFMFDIAITATISGRTEESAFSLPRLDCSIRIFSNEVFCSAGGSFGIVHLLSAIITVDHDLFSFINLLR